MTQIINLIWGRYVYHLSDRLVTRQQRSRFSVFDPNSNKTIVYRARDGYLVVGYTGLAFLDGVPTDKFLAQLIVGQQVGEGIVTHVSRDSGSVDTNTVLNRLYLGLSEFWARIPKADQSAPFELTIAGWHQLPQRSVAMPVIWALEKAGGDGRAFRARRAWRWIDWRRRFSASFAPSPAPVLVEELMRELAGMRQAPLEDVEATLGRAMLRIRGDRPETVGSSYLRVRLSPWEDVQVRVRMTVSDQDRVSMRGVPHEGFSPWIINPPTVFSPAELRGNGATGLDEVGSAFRWRVEAPGPPLRSSTCVSHSAQKRRSDPTR